MPIFCFQEIPHYDFYVHFDTLGHKYFHLSYLSSRMLLPICTIMYLHKSALIINAFEFDFYYQKTIKIVPLRFIFCSFKHFSFARQLCVIRHKTQK